MFEIIKKIWHTGVVTDKVFLDDAPSSYSGRLEFHFHECNHCGKCVEVCPTGALNMMQTEKGMQMSVIYGKCIFCGMCTETCENLGVKMTNDYHLATKDKKNMLQVS